MSDPDTLRVLEIDGGGERGYLSLNFLKEFVQLWGINSNNLWSHFDVICGTSVGGLMSLAFAMGFGIADISPFFTVQGPYIFTLGTNTGLPPVPPFGPSPSIRPSLPFKLALLVANTPFYSSSGFYVDQYGSGLLAKTIQDLGGTRTLQNLETNVIIPAYQFDTSTYVLFSNLYFPDYIGQTALVSDVALSTSAAPAYLPKWSFGGHQYVDGGVYLNNPARFGLTQAKMIKPNASRYCVLSLGTGVGETGFDPGGVPPPPSPVFETLPLLKGGNKNPHTIKFASDLLKLPTVGGPADTLMEVWKYGAVGRNGCQEAFAKDLYLESTYTLENLYYYRFQPPLDKQTYDTELDNTDPTVLTYYENLAVSVFNSDINNIRTFLGHLTA